MKKYILLLLILFAQVATAETWKLDKYIQVSPPDGADVTFQIFEAYDPKEKILMGWNGDNLEYMFVVDEQPGGKKDSIYWKGLERELKNGSDNKRLKILSKGKYSTNSGLEVNYKIYSWVSEGESYVQMANLVKNKKIAYWVLVSPTENDKIKVVERKAIQILKTSELPK